MRTPASTAASLAGAERREHPGVQDRWRSSHSATKRRDILTPTTTWLDPEDTAQRISRTQRDKHCVIPLTGGPQGSQSHRDRKQMVAPGAGGEGRGVSVSWGQRVSLGR